MQNNAEENAQENVEEGDTEENDTIARLCRAQSFRKAETTEGTKKRSPSATGGARSRRRVTKDVVLEEIDDLIEKIDNHIDKLRKTMGGQSGSRFLRGVRNRLIKIRKDTYRMKRNRTYRPDTTMYEVSDELGSFLDLDDGGKISRLDLQWAMSAYIHLDVDETREGILKWKRLNPKNRDLRNPNDKKIITPDKKLDRLLGYQQYKKSVSRGEVYVRNKDKTLRRYDDDSLKYWVVMKLLQPHLTKMNKPPEHEVEKDEHPEKQKNRSHSSGDDDA